MNGGRTPYNSGKTPNPYSGDSRTPAWNASSRTPNPYSDSRTPAWNASSRTPNPYATDGGRTPAWNVSSRTPNPYATGANAGATTGSGYGGATPGRNVGGWQTPGRAVPTTAWTPPVPQTEGWGSPSRPSVPTAWDSWVRYLLSFFCSRILTATYPLCVCVFRALLLRVLLLHPACMLVPRQHMRHQLPIVKRQLLVDGVQIRIMLPHPAL